jgi:hypothetical protein
MSDSLLRRRNFSVEQKERLAGKVAEVLASHSEVVFAYLHGSFVNEVTFRDLDVAVYVKPQSINSEALRGYESNLVTELQDKVKMPVDIRVLNDAPLAFRYHAIRGRLLMVRDPELLDEYRARIWDDYFDFVPFARQYLREAMCE